MRIIELKDKDVNDLITLMDFAVKAQGLSVAAIATVLFGKIQAAQVVEESVTSPRVDPKPKKN